MMSLPQRHSSMFDLPGHSGEARHVSNTHHRDRRSRHRCWQELIPRFVGLDQRGATMLCQKRSGRQVEARFANMPPCLIGVEACVRAHHLRRLKALGHDARLMPARYVMRRRSPRLCSGRTMKFVAMKTADRLDLQALHRVRERLLSQSTGIIDQIRAFLLERGGVTASCAPSCCASWLLPQMSFRHAWRWSSRIWLKRQISTCDRKISKHGNRYYACLCRRRP